MDANIEMRAGPAAWLETYFGEGYSLGADAEFIKTGDHAVHHHPGDIWSPWFRVPSMV
jgi:hypothetical protein